MFKKMFGMFVCMLLLLNTTAYAIPEIKDTLSSISFELDESVNTQNAKNAARIINKKIIYPKEEFSFNGIVGQRTKQNGFILGHYPVYENGKITAYYVIGSGVCRTSTGVYMAAKYANLQIVERWAHIVPVDYVKTGDDAAVDWGSADLRFINNQTYPIQILIEINENNVLKAEIIRYK